MHEIKKAYTDFTGTARSEIYDFRNFTCISFQVNNIGGNTIKIFTTFLDEGSNNNPHSFNPVELDDGFEITTDGVHVVSPVGRYYYAKVTNRVDSSAITGSFYAITDGSFPSPRRDITLSGEDINVDLGDLIVYFEGAENYFGERNSVPTAVEETIVSYTVPIDSNFLLLGAKGSANTNVKFRVKVDGATESRGRNSWCTRDTEFRITKFIPAGSVITLTGLHQEPCSVDIFGNLYGTLVPIPTP